MVRVGGVERRLRGRRLGGWSRMVGGSRGKDGEDRGVER